MSRLVVVLLRLVLVVLLLGLLLAQVLTPIVAHETGTQFPEFQRLVVPYSVLAILAIACIQSALAMVWKLLSLTTRGEVFTARALPWVDAIIISAAVATLLALAVLIHVIGIVQTGGPGVLLALLGSVAAGSGLVLLMTVLRGLLKSATEYRSELAEVI